MHALELLTKKLVKAVQESLHKEDAVRTLGDVLRQRKVLPDPGNPRYDSLLFTNKAIEKMKVWNLTEADVADVFFHGMVIKEHLMSRKYNGYEIGLVYGRDRRSGQYIIYAAWKRERR